MAVCISARNLGTHLYIFLKKFAVQFLRKIWWQLLKKTMYTKVYVYKRGRGALVGRLITTPVMQASRARTSLIRRGSFRETIIKR